MTTSVTETTELSNRTPSLVDSLGSEAAAASPERRSRDICCDTEPRIATPGGRDRDGQTSISITPYMMAAGEEKIVAERIHAILSNPPKQDAPARTAAPAADVTGQWDVRIEYAANTSTPYAACEAGGQSLEGTHQGDFVSRDLAGTIDGNSVQIVQLVHRAARRRLELPLQRHRRGGHDVGNARHGRVPDGEVEAKRHDYRRG